VTWMRRSHALMLVACARTTMSLQLAAVRPAARPAALALTHQRVRLFAMKANDQGVEYAVKKSDEEWKQDLSPEEFYILREKGTERPGTGKYDKFYPKDGHFVCAGCRQPLYSAAAKFDSGCGWPAFDRIVEGAVVTQTDSSMGMTRVEILCGGCGGHLGHVFEGERMTPTNERHCVNSLSVKYVDEPLPSDKSEAKVLPKRAAETRSSLLEELLGKK